MEHLSVMFSTTMAAMIGYELDLFVGKDWHIDQFDACDWSLCIFAVFSLVNIQFVYALQAPCHTSRISQSLNWENGILTICWAGFKFHWLRGEMLLLDCSSRVGQVGRSFPINRWPVLVVFKDRLQIIRLFFMDPSLGSWEIEARIKVHL